MTRPTGVGDGPAFPGGVGLTALRVYPWGTPDDLHGGSPHLHLTCTEAYVVTAGWGEVHTIGGDGVRQTPLAPGDVVWFSPGTIHRLVNGDGELRIVVVMQNDGLPEAGDAVLTFPDEYLADPQTYRSAASVLDPDTGQPDETRARARRDLAIAGFLALRERIETGDGQALERLYTAANRLVAGRLDGWHAHWERSALATARATGEQIDALRRGDHGHLHASAVRRVVQPTQDTLGMCGHLSPYRLR